MLTAAANHRFTEPRPLKKKETSQPIDSFFWTEPRLWREANLSLSRTIGARKPELEPLRRRALRLEALLDFVIPLMEELCQERCPACPDPCCISARARFDLSDLVFMHLAGQAVPLAQAGPRENPGCLYLGPRGCLLPRLSRPWICRWYICPQQKRLLRHYPASGQRRFELAISRIRRLRSDLRDAFVLAISG